MRIPRHLVGMRWWLGLAFALVAALTALAVVAELNNRSEHAFHNYAEAFAVGRSVLTAEMLQHAATPAALRRNAAGWSHRKGVRLYVLDAKGKLITPTLSRSVEWTDVPFRDSAAKAALSGNRFIRGNKDGSEFVVGLPVRDGAGAAVVTYSRQQGLQAALGIIRDEYLQAALIAFAVSAALGLLIASLTARRLGRLADAASAIGSGDFDQRIQTRFPDEVGSLALSIERMRAQLQELFLALHRDRDRLETLLDRLDDGVLVVNRQLEIEFANDRARELVVDDARILEGRLRRLAVDLFATGLPNHLRLTAESRTLDVSGVPPVEGGDNAIIVVHDQTQTEQNEKVQREFATNAAHELRSPLASIVTAVEMLQTGAKEDPAARDEFLEVIAREAARLTRLTRALLVLARADAGDETPRRRSIDVAPLLEQVAASLPHRPNVDVVVDCSSTLAITGDPDLLEQALSSVAVNALQYTEEGRIELRGRGQNGSVVIEVADTGQGIPASEQRRIFDRFYRAGERDDGFGLGLSIAREAVSALGGQIDLDSEVAVGTTVRITLERAGAAR